MQITQIQSGKRGFLLTSVRFVPEEAGGRKEIRQFRHVGTAGTCFDQLRQDLGRARHVGDRDHDSLFLADRRVELGDQAVHRRIGLFAVDMPHR